MSRLLRIGAVVVAVVALYVVLGRGSTRHELTAEFTDVRGLVAGAQVRLAGVEVGEVQRIWLAADGWPRVRMAIDDGVSMRAGGTAAVRMTSLSGEFNRYVSIVQGSGAPLAQRALIPRSRTSSPTEVDDAISAFTPAARSALSAMLGGLRTTLAGQGPALAATLRQSQPALSEIGALAGQIEGDGADLQTLLTGTRALASTLATHAPQLAGTVRSAALVLHGVAVQASALAGGVVALPTALDATDGALRSVQRVAEPASRLLGTVAPAVAELPAASSELRAALQAGRPTLRRAAQVATLAPAASDAFAPLLRAAGPLLAVMTPVLHGLGPMLDQLRVRLPDAFSFFSNWADFTSNYDANGHAARVGIVLPPAPTRLLSPSSNGPGQLAPPYLRVPGALEGQPWTDYAKSFVAGGTPGPDVDPGAAR
ncbi:MAG TPA: MlaD family protein [Solirubrobacteraceae bacterium]|nr:MlaD family protein [Solirubrobacteraceae bacterium]